MPRTAANIEYVRKKVKPFFYERNRERENEREEKQEENENMNEEIFITCGNCC
jgi:hypothetical protein